MASTKKPIEQHKIDLEDLKKRGEAPLDMDLEAYVTLYKNLYEYDGVIETPFDLYRRVAKEAAKYLPKQPGIEEDFFYLISNNYLGLATPVAANLGTPAKTLPISCYVIDVQDSVEGIFGGLFRAAMLTKGGGGVGVGLTPIREQGSIIKGGGRSNGAKPWATIYDWASRIVSQAGVRRGQFAFWINIESNDLWDFLLSKDHSKGDPKSHIVSNIAVNISDAFMQRLFDGDPDAVARWNAVMRTRLMSGSPYLHFIDNANRDLVQCMKDSGKRVSGSNICTEITSCADENYDMICCLASLNLYKFDEWFYWISDITGMNIFETSIYFLDAIMSSFIHDVQKWNFPGSEKALAYAIKGRPLGLGEFGYHAHLMKNMIPFKSKKARDFNEHFFSFMSVECDKASRNLARDYGTCEWADSVGRRNIQTTSIAPTVGNSVTNMGITPGIEPIAGHYYEAKGAAGSWTRINPILVEYLKGEGIYTEEIMDSILENNGSVQHLEQLTEFEKEVFLTFVEIDQREIIYQAAARQKYLEQTQSVNLSFREDADADYISDVHTMAYESGMHTLYYLRSNSVQRTAIVENDKKSKSVDKNETSYMVLTKPGCPWCDKAFELLETQGLNYDGFDYNPDHQSYHKFYDVAKDWKTFPKIVKLVNNQQILIGGYTELAAHIYGEATVGNSEKECEWCD